MIKSCLKVFVALGLIRILDISAADWPQYRGPNRNGATSEELNLAWPKEGPAILWKSNAGLGLTSMSVADNLLFTVGHAEGQDTVFCFDAVSGKQVWKHSYDADLGDKYFEGGTTGTPTFNNGTVYTLSRWGDVFAFEAKTGKILWNRNLQKDAEVRVPTWGFAGSPIIHNNLLLLNVGESGMALDPKTGKTVWESAKKDSGYSTPLIINRGGHTEMLLGSGQAYLAVDPSNGKEIWRMRWVTQYGVNAADPVVDGDFVFIASGYGKGCALLKLNNSPEPETIWKSKVIRSQMNPAILHEGYLYGFDGDNTDKASLKCVEFKTGTEKWKQESLGLGAVTLAGKTLLVIGERGELIAAPVSSESFQPAARAQVTGGKNWTAPVVANGLVYCRNSRGDIVCVDLRKK